MPCGRREKPIRPPAPAAEPTTGNTGLGPLSQAGRQGFTTRPAGAQPRGPVTFSGRGPTSRRPGTLPLGDEVGMWLVNLALRRPYTVSVGILLTLVLGLVSYLRTPTDILPNLKIPVVVVFASYRGMPAPDMEQSVTAVLERALTRCDHLEHLDSRSLPG